MFHTPMTHSSKSKVPVASKSMMANVRSVNAVHSTPQNAMYWRTVSAFDLTLPGPADADRRRLLFFFLYFERPFLLKDVHILSKWSSSTVHSDLTMWRALATCASSPASPAQNSGGILSSRLMGARASIGTTLRITDVAHPIVTTWADQGRR